ncbi:MAG: SAM-dependent methyltransferase [Bryobacteraceae bacterium]
MMESCAPSGDPRLLLERLTADGPPAPALDTLQRLTPWKQLVQDYRPVADSLEWRLARLLWCREGVAPFVRGVPFLVNNDGRLSADAAAVLFANCQEAVASGPIRVLELGAGTGLFARYLLDEFRGLCRRNSRDFYDRLQYRVTDASPRTVQQWSENGVFHDHAAVVLPQVLNAAEAGGAEAVRAVFCNYVLDVLPAAFLRRTPAGWEQLWVRTWIGDDPAVLRQYTRLTFDEMRALAASDALEGLLPVLPLLEFEADFLPVGGQAPPGLAEIEEGSGAPFTYNYGAIACLRSLGNMLEDGGFILVNDYAPPESRDAGCTPGQRFGPITGAGLNFPLVEALLRRCELTCCEPEGDAARRLHARLVSRGGLANTLGTFRSRFAAAALEQADAPIQQARQQAGAGLLREALASYRAAMERNPRNWQVIGEAAAFVAAELRDPAAGLELARAAAALNPWYSPFLWVVLGDCLAALERDRDAHECYLQAHRIHPSSPEPNLRLAGSWLRIGDPVRSLEAVARGLAGDSDAMFRHVLLERQQQAIDALAIRWNAECAAAARRSGVRGGGSGQ